MPRQTLTARYVEAIKPPASSRTEHWDASTPGFGLRVSALGRKSWVLMYRHEGRLRRLTIGTYPALPLGEARERARDAIRQAAKGGDPAGDKSINRRAETFADMAADYMERHAKLRKKSWHRDELMLQRDLLPWFGNHKAKAVSRRDVNALLDSIMDRGAPVQANRTLQILKRIYNWGISREIVEVNPCAMIRPPGEEKPRERVLSEDELRAVWHALDSEEVLLAALFRVRILTAQRGGEVATMRRRDLDLAGGWWTIPPEFSKNGLKSSGSSFALGHRDNRESRRERRRSDMGLPECNERRSDPRHLAGGQPYSTPLWY